MAQSEPDFEDFGFDAAADDEPDAFFVLVDSFEDDSFEDESFDDDAPESFADDSLEPPDESDEPDDESVELDDDFSRLSVLKKPDPLKVTPTGWKTFLTAIWRPVSGCLILVSVSSVKACWTSMVSPVLTNL